MAIIGPVLAGMLVLGAVTTADQPTNEACPEMDPGISDGDTPVTDIRDRVSDGGQLLKMFTRCHLTSLATDYGLGFAPIIRPAF